LSEAHDLSFLGYVSQQYITKSRDGTKRAVNAYDKIMSQFESVIGLPPEKWSSLK
jgi:hypothetical protein